MIFVAAFAAASGLGVLAFLTHIPMPPAVSLSQRLAPLADARIGLTLATTFLFFSGAFTIYTYLAVVFARATGSNPAWLSGLLVFWGVAGTVSNLLTGRITDKIGNRQVLVTMLLFVLADFLLLPWTSAGLWTAIPAIALWGACGWGVLVPQQHRLISIAAPIAPVLLGLNSSATFLGTTAAGIVGAAGIDLLGGDKLGYVAAVFVAAALIVSELAAWKIAAANQRNMPAQTASIVTPIGAAKQGKA
jgi:predicted MFS family arabinose efflux permease